MTPDELARFFAEHPGWKGDETALRRTFEFASYPEAVGFTVSVAVVADKRDHHPDLLLTWGRVEVTLTTHDAGGVSPLDVDLATTCDLLWRSGAPKAS